MLKRSYEPPRTNEKTLSLAKKVTSLIVSSDVTYKEAMDALEYALTLLELETKPIIVLAPEQVDLG